VIILINVLNNCKVDGINMNRMNPRYLSEFEMPSNITAFTNPAEALEGCDIILHALPAQVLVLLLCFIFSNVCYLYSFILILRKCTTPTQHHQSSSHIYINICIHTAHP
jgi:glycerol-3-phosphate dehydrogenase